MKAKSLAEMNHIVKIFWYGDIGIQRTITDANSTYGFFENMSKRKTIIHIKSIIL